MSATAILGVVGLATEVGAWYLAHEQVYSAADSAAIAGALAATHPNSGVAGAVKEVTLLNSYNATSVTTNVPPHSGNYTANSDAVEVLISINVLPTISRLFNVDGVTLTARAVGLVGPTGSYACALSLSGALTIAQSQNGNGNGPCFYASNSAGTAALTGSSAVTFLNGATMQAAGITTPGDCSATCPSVQNPVAGGSDSSGNNWLGRPNAWYQPATPDPYAAAALGSTLAQAIAGVTIVCPVGLSYPNGTATYPSSGPFANCPQNPNTPVTVSTSYLVPAVGDAVVGGSVNPGATCLPTPGQVCAYYNMALRIVPATPVTVSPPLLQHNLQSTASATYLFLNASLDVQPRATLQCEAYWNLGSGPPAPFCGLPDTSLPNGAIGVSFVFAGSQPGRLTIESGAVVTLAAAGANDFSSALNGMLFYRTGMAANESATLPGVNIADDAAGDVNLAGGMYFPDSYASFTGNSNPNVLPVCSVIVAGYLYLGPSAADSNPTQLSSACGSYNLAVPAVQAAQVVE